MKKIRLIIFDMDGTLFDTEALGNLAWKEALLKFNFKYNKELFKSKIGLNANDSRQLMEQHYGPGFDYLTVKEYKRKIVEDYILLNETPLKKGVIELLNTIEGTSVKTSIATSRGSKMAEFYLANSQICDSFDYVITGDKVDNGKPNPEIYNKVISYFGVDKNEVLIVEDSSNGIIGANRAGVTCVYIEDIINYRKDLEAYNYIECADFSELKYLVSEYI